MGYKFNDSFTPLPSNLVSKGHDCEYCLKDVCFGEVSVKRCLLCHRAEMVRARDEYLAFYKNIYLPWVNDGDFNCEQN